MNTLPDSHLYCPAGQDEIKFGRKCKNSAGKNKIWQEEARKGGREAGKDMRKILANIVYRLTTVLACHL